MNMENQAVSEAKRKQVGGLKKVMNGNKPVRGANAARGNEIEYLDFSTFV